MKRSSLLTFALVSGLLFSACGTRSSLSVPGAECGPWSVHDGAAGLERRPRAPFAVLGDGSVVLATEDSVIAGTGGGLSTGTSYGDRLRRIGPDGEIAWDSVGGPHVWLTGVARDAAGTLVVLGGVPSGAHEVPGVTCPGNRCFFIAKLTETGALAWSKVVPWDSGLAVVRWPSDLAVTGDGRITIEGAFDSTIDLGCGPLTAIAVEAGGSASRYLAQLSPSGECLWSRAILGTPRIDPAADRIAVGDDGEVALAVPLATKLGAQTIDLGGGQVPFETEKGPGFAVAKYAPNGDLVFAKVVTSESAAPAPHHNAPLVNVAVTRAGEVLLSAGYEGTLDLGGGPKGSPGSMRHFVAKLGANGEELWTRDIATGSGYSFELAIERGGDFFLAGHGLPGMKILGEPTPETALFVAAYDAGGEPVDVRTFPFTGTTVISGLDASADGALVLVGTFDGTLDFGQDLLVPEGTRDGFVARICR